MRLTKWKDVFSAAVRFSHGKQRVSLYTLFTATLCAYCCFYFILFIYFFPVHGIYLRTFSVCSFVWSTLTAQKKRVHKNRHTIWFYPRTVRECRGIFPSLGKKIDFSPLPKLYCSTVPGIHSLWMKVNEDKERVSYPLSTFLFLFFDTLHHFHFNFSTHNIKYVNGKLTDDSQVSMLRYGLKKGSFSGYFAAISPRRNESQRSECNRCFRAIFHLEHTNRRHNLHT